MSSAPFRASPWLLNYQACFQLSDCLRPGRHLQLDLPHQTELKQWGNYLSNSGNGVYFSWITWITTSSLIRWKEARVTFWWFYCPLNNAFLFKRSDVKNSAVEACVFLICQGCAINHLAKTQLLSVQGSCGRWLLRPAEERSCLGFLACSLCLWESSPQLMRWQRGRLLGVEFSFLLIISSLNYRTKHAEVIPVFPGLAPGQICNMKRCIRVARPRFSQQGSWPEPGEAVPARGTGNPLLLLLSLSSSRKWPNVSEAEVSVILPKESSSSQALGHPSGASVHQSFLSFISPQALLSTVSFPSADRVQSSPALASRKQGSKWDWVGPGQSQWWMEWHY